MSYLGIRTGGLLGVSGAALLAGHLLLGRGDAPVGRATAQEGDRPLTFTVARVDVASRKSFDQVTRALEAAAPKADFTLFESAGSPGTDAADIRKQIDRLADKDGLLILAHSAVGKRQSQLLGKKVRSKLYFIGNPLIASRMIGRDPVASLYVPLRVLVYADRDGKAHVAYDRPSSVLGSLGDAEITRVAKMLDRKLEELIMRATE